MHLQQQECWSCNFVLKILHNHTMVNYFYGNMCTHNHISLNLSFVYCCQLSSFLFQCHHLHMDGDHFCPAISRMNCIFHQICLCYVWTYICIFVIILIFFIFVYMWFSYTAYFICSIFWIHFAQILSKWCIWPIYRYIIYYCIIFCLHILLYTCFVVLWGIFSVSANLFFAVIIMSICTHSHGSAKQGWHRSWSMVSYMLTSTKISFVKLCEFMMTWILVWYYKWCHSCTLYIVLSTWWA